MTDLPADVRCIRAALIDNKLNKWDADHIADCLADNPAALTTLLERAGWIHGTTDGIPIWQEPPVEK